MGEPLTLSVPVLRPTPEAVEALARLLAHLARVRAAERVGSPSR